MNHHNSNSPLKHLKKNPTQIYYQSSALWSHLHNCPYKCLCVCFVCPLTTYSQFSWMDTSWCSSQRESAMTNTVALVRIREGAYEEEKKLPETLVHDGHEKKLSNRSKIRLLTITNHSARTQLPCKLIPKRSQLPPNERKKYNNKKSSYLLNKIRAWCHDTI